MLFIFGWNRQIVKEYGPVEQRICPNCHNEEFWQLSKISKWFTLFFAPIVAYERHYYMTCPICHNGVELENESVFKNFKAIAEINSVFLEERITDDERIIQLKKSYDQLNQYEETKRTKYIEESKGFQTLVKSKPDDELFKILKEERSNYNPAFIIAVEEEVEKRRED